MVRVGIGSHLRRRVVIGDALARDWAEPAAALARDVIAPVEQAELHVARRLLMQSDETPLGGKGVNKRVLARKHK